MCSNHRSIVKLYIDDESAILLNKCSFDQGAGKFHGPSRNDGSNIPRKSEKGNRAANRKNSPDRLNLKHVFLSLKQQPGLSMHLTLIALSFIGLYISTYFVSAYYGVISPASRLVPRFCRLETGACQSVINHPDASLFGIPNSLLGIGYYSCILFGAALEFPGFLAFARIASWVAVVFALYLVHSLYFKIKVACPLCLASHAINVVSAVMLTFLW